MRKLFLTFILGTFILIIAGCSNEGTNTTEQGQQILIVGLECLYPPYNWTTNTETDSSYPIDGTNSYCDGYDIQMARTIAGELGYTLVIKALDWQGLIPALRSNQIDVIIAGMSPTSNRKLSIDFTDAYYRSPDTTQQTLVVLKNGDYANATSIHDFSGANIAAQLGTLQDEEGLIEQMTGANHATALDDYPTLVVALESGTIDGFIAEVPVATQITNNNSNLAMISFTEGEGFILNEAFTTTAIGLRKGDTDLRDAINQVLAGISEEQRTAWMDEFINKSSESSE